MAKKKGGFGKKLDFGLIKPYGNGGTKQGELERRQLETILPDTNQPRSLLKAELREMVNAGIASADILERWRQAAFAPNAPPFVKQNYEAVVQLANSIAQDGLINPITIREVETGVTSANFLIVTGERRWWAHVYLLITDTMILGNIDPSYIPVHIVGANNPIRAQQVAENWHREEMSLVDKARGLLALRYEMSGKMPEGNIPKKLVTWNEVEKKIGIGRTHRHRITSVLVVPTEGQEIVQDYNLKESAIRPILLELKEQPALQVEALKIVAKWANGDEGQITQAKVNGLVKALLRGGAKPRAALPKSLDWKKFRRTIKNTVNLLDVGDNVVVDVPANVKGDDELMGLLRQLRQKIDGLFPDLE